MRQWGEEVESQAAGYLGGREGSPVAGCKAGSGLHPAFGRLTVTPQGVQSQAPRNAGGGRAFGLRKTRLGWSGSSRERGTRRQSSNPYQPGDLGLSGPPSGVPVRVRMPVPWGC